MAPHGRSPPNMANHSRPNSVRQSSTTSLTASRNSDRSERLCWPGDDRPFHIVALAHAAGLAPRTSHSHSKNPVIQSNYNCSSSYYRDGLRCKMGLHSRFLNQGRNDIHIPKQILYQRLPQAFQSYFLVAEDSTSART